MVQLTSNYSVVPNNTIKLFRRIKESQQQTKNPYFHSKNVKILINANRQKRGY